MLTSHSAFGRKPAQAKVVGGAIKRGFDLVIASLLLLFLSPVMIGVAIAVRLTDPGPCLFWSRRVGRNGVEFQMPKYRTMRMGSPLVARESIAKAEAYLTPIGNFLRKSSLDELPQLLCVLLGQMSLIGPRPLLPTDQAAKLRIARTAAMQARPGITGLAQIRGRNFLTMHRKIRYDEAYVRHWSFGLDLRIFRETVVSVLLRKDVI